MKSHATPQSLAISLAFLLAAVGTAAAQGGTDEGRLTVHDEANAPATVDVSDCTFVVRGHGIPVAEGSVDVYENRGRGGLAIIERVEFTGEPRGDGSYDFVTGEITLDATDSPAGQRIYIEVIIEGERDEGVDPERYVSTNVRVHCGDAFVECISDLRAEAIADGEVRLSWTATAEADSYRIHRHDGSQLANGQPDWESLGETEQSTFVDSTAEAGTSYRYQVQAVEDGEGSSSLCPIVTVTAVPFFGTPIVGAIAVVGAVAAYGLSRRSRA